MKTPLHLCALLFALTTMAATAAPPPVVLATIKPVHALVAGVMSGAGTPDLLISGAQSEHSYAFRPSDARKVVRAELIFQVGPVLETYLTAPLNRLSHGKVVALADAPGLTRLSARNGGLWQSDGDHDGPEDPHIWLDPQNAIVMTRTIAAALIAADPSRRMLYQHNADIQITRLNSLDAALRRQLTPVKGHPYLVFHDAYQYFEHHYGLSPAGSVTVAPDRPVGPRRIVALRREVASGQAICLFREPQFPPRLIDTIAEGSTVRTGVLDPLGAALQPGPALYPALMHALADALTGCLRR